MSLSLGRGACRRRGRVLAKTASAARMDRRICLCRTGFVVGLVLMALACCMMETPFWLMAVTGSVGSVLALACVGGTGWVEGGDKE